MTEKRRIKPMPFWQKYTLTVAEACSYFHIGERKMRESSFYSAGIQTGLEIPANNRHRATYANRE